MCNLPDPSCHRNLPLDAVVACFFSRPYQYGFLTGRLGQWSTRSRWVDVIEKRRRVTDDWARHCDTLAADVVALRVRYAVAIPAQSIFESLRPQAPRC
jgi:hypothetical protein